MAKNPQDATVMKLGFLGSLDLFLISGIMFAEETTTMSTL